jgi:hypothetical protein
VRKGVVQVKVVVGGNCELAYGTRHPAPTKRGPPVRVFRACACAIYRGPGVICAIRPRARACVHARRARVRARMRAYARLYLARVRGYYLRVRCQYWRAACPRGGRCSGMLDSGAECVQSVTVR